MLLNKTSRARMIRNVVVGAAMGVGIMVSQGAAAPCSYQGAPAFCQWTTGCFSIDDEYGEPPGLTCTQYVESCITNGSLFHGVTGLDASNNWGEGLNCLTQGGTFVDGKDPTATVLGCCWWSETGDYSNITTADPPAQESYCMSGSNKYWQGVSCPTSGAPAGTPTYDGSTLDLIYCRFEGNPAECWQKTEEECSADYGENVGPLQSGCDSPTSGVYCDWGEPSEYGEGGCAWLAAGAEACAADYGTVVSSCDGVSIRTSARTRAITNPLVSIRGRTLSVSGAQSSRVTVQIIDLRGRAVAKYDLRGGSSVTLGRKVVSGSYIVSARRVEDGFTSSVRLTVE